MEKDLIWNKADSSYQTELGETVTKIEENNYVFEFKDQVLDSVREWAIGIGNIVP